MHQEVCHMLVIAVNWHILFGVIRMKMVLNSYLLILSTTLVHILLLSVQCVMDKPLKIDSTFMLDVYQRMINSD